MQDRLLVHSHKEIEDIYLRLDLEIARLLKELDSSVGEGNYTLFLTADHGVAEIPAFLKKNNAPAGILFGSEFTKPITEIINEHFGNGDWVLGNSNYQIHLNRDLMAKKNVSINDIVRIISPKLSLREGIYSVINLEELGANIPPFYKEKLQNIYNPKRSGEIMVLLEPAWFSGYSARGTTHGSMWPYDTHVPLLWYGNGINTGETIKPTFISGIAPTVSQLLNIQEPNGNVGTPIKAVLK